MDKTEFHRISGVIEACVEKMEPPRLSSMLLMFEALAKAYADREGGMIVVQLMDEGVMISSINVNEVTASEVLGAISIRMHNDLMEGAPPKGMLN